MSVIQHIRIKNFKNFGDEFVEFSFNPNFTVIIGVNGKGKTSILQALRIACGSYLLGIPEAESKHIEYDEIRREIGKYAVLKTPVIIEAAGIFEKNAEAMLWRRQIPLNRTKTTSNQEDVGNIRNLGKSHYEIKQQNPDNQIDLPVLAFFGVSRLSGASRNTKNNRRMMREPFKEGYDHWKEIQSPSFLYPRWLGSYDILVREGKEYEGLDKIFYETIQKANPYLTDIQFQDGELWVKTNIEGEQKDLMPLSLCSDGINSFTGMIAELAFRCIVLNAHLGEKVMQETIGLVMIDELDLHLHPNWQKRVVADLKNAFPALQFVTTTHSPFIVQSLKANELINLDSPTDFEPYKQGLEEVAQEVMQVKDAQRSQRYQEMLAVSKQYFEVLASANQETDQETLHQKLDELLMPFYEDAAFVSFLKLNRLAQLGK